MAITIKDLMEQAVVYACAWRMVGVDRPGHDEAKARQEKRRLEEMLEDFQEQESTNATNKKVLELAEGLIEWHQNKLVNFNTILEAPLDSEIQLGKGEDVLVLKGARAEGFRVGLTIAREWIEKFPLSIERNTPATDEEQ